MKLILLHGKLAKSQGLSVMVDDEDFEAMSKYKWYPLRQPGKRVTYAVRTETILRASPGTKRKQQGTRMHRQILRVTGAMIVDHIDGNGLNNQKSNLRLCTYAQNSANGHAIRKRKSKFRGVHWCAQLKKWAAKITQRGIHRHLGLFDDELVAAQQYDWWNLKLNGDFARINFQGSRKLAKPPKQLLVDFRVAPKNIDRSRGRWRVRIIRDGVRRTLGTFDSVEDAIRCRDLFLSNEAKARLPRHHRHGRKGESRDVREQ